MKNVLVWGLLLVLTSGCSMLGSKADSISEERKPYSGQVEDQDLPMLPGKPPTFEEAELYRNSRKGRNIPQRSLINGEEVPKSDWPMVVMVRTGNGSCTGTIVGPRAMVYAAHCGENGQTASFSINGKSYTAKITRSPVYPRQDHDVAMGLVNPPVTGIPYATVAPLAYAKKGMKIRLMGYGCTRPGGGGGNDGKLRTGLSQVVGMQGFGDLVTRMPGGAALCFGDSGGPAWPAVPKGDPSQYLIMSDNSKGNIEDTSYLTRLDTEDSHYFIRQWAASNGNVEVCGVTAKCQSEGPIEPKPEPEDNDGRADFGFFTDEALLRVWVKPSGQPYKGNIRAIAIDAAKKMKKPILEIYPAKAGAASAAEEGLPE